MAKRLRMINWICPSCLYLTGEKLVDLHDLPEPVSCPECSQPLELYTLGAPRVMKDSYPDGTSVIPLQKEWARLECERVGTHYQDPDRKRIQAEQKKIRSGAYRRTPK